MLTRLLCLLIFSGLTMVRAQDAGSIRGEVLDPSGALVPGAAVSLKGPSGDTRTTTTSDLGAYMFEGLAAGKYTIRIAATGFSPFEVRNFKLSANQKATFKSELVIATEAQTVTVADYAEVTVDPQSTAAAIVLTGKDLEVLSDNPDDLASDLQALAGPSAGPNGGEIYVDGFSGGKLPPKSSIREVRINSNPFSAEYDRMGFGRIEIFTKPGTDKLRGQAFFNFGDESLNSRNPFAPNRAPYQQRFFGFNIGGPLQKKLSWFLDVDRREIDENAVVNATTLDSSLNPTTFAEAIVTPQRRWSINPRLDYALSNTQTLVFRYQHGETEAQGGGVGNFTLPSRATTNSNRDDTFQLTHTAVLSPTVINESRFQYMSAKTATTGDNSVYGLIVLDAFNGGGAPLGFAGDKANSYEYQNITSINKGKHFMKFGGRVRHASVDDSTDQNFNGTYTFTGSAGVTSLDSYRITLLGLQQGLSDAEIRAMGGGASQFTMTTGVPLAAVAQTDIGLFGEDSWRIRPNFTLNYGLRFETQNNIPVKPNLAPRFSIAWGLDGHNGKPTLTVLRAGFGMFYDRVNNNLMLQTLRFNGSSQVQYFVPNPDFFPFLPDTSNIAGSVIQPTVRKFAAGIQAPYTAQGVLGVDRSLPRNTTLSVNLVYSRGVHQLRTRNVNAPLISTGEPPYGDIGNVYQYESSGYFRQMQLMTNLRTRLTSKINLFGFYVYGHAKSDTDGSGSFPFDQYNAALDYGRAGFDVRHRFMLGGHISTKWGLEFNPFITASSGRPFNITTGRDNNGDTVFNDRPAFATDLTAPGVVITQFGAFNLNPTAADVIIPRNYGAGPSQFTINLRMSRTWGFGAIAKRQEPGGPEPGSMPPPMGGPGGGPGGGGPGGGGGMRGGGGGGMRGGPGGMFGSSSDNRYSLTFGVAAMNLLNHVNYGTPIGNLSSALFGESNSTAGGFGPGGGGGAGNRRIEMSLRFSF